MRKITIFFIILLSFSFSAFSQRKKPLPKVPKPPVVSITNELREGAEKVSIQLKNVSKFNYLLGSIATGIQDLDKEAKAGKISRELASQNEANKQKVITSIRGLRAGLIQLESDFRTKPKLRLYQISIQGVSDTAAAAEDQAMRGEFANAGKTLLLVVERLADTLVAMP
jgi:hypothetical protein